MAAVPGTCNTFCRTCINTHVHTHSDDTKPLDLVLNNQMIYTYIQQSERNCTKDIKAELNSTCA